MRVIIPMAGMGKRLRPHTLTTPKPLLHIAGKPIVHHLVEDIAEIIRQPIEEIAYIIGDFGKEVEESLCSIAQKVGAKPSIYYQEQPLGTAHAILCAKQSLTGNIIVAFADTLFRADFTLNTDKDAVIWVKEVENPSQFGVVQLNEKQEIINFVEKPKTFVSNLAIIGIYYFQSGESLYQELQRLIDLDIKSLGEYQLTDALAHMLQKGKKMGIAGVKDWMDCGNKQAILETNQNVLNHLQKDNKIRTFVYPNSVIVPPCYIAQNAQIHNSIIGPYVSVGENALIENAIISHSIVNANAQVQYAHIHYSIVGKYATVKGTPLSVNLGDYSNTEL
ncbi:MAG: sugar phosphate nucleotidyltransferase [Bacteroidia bacterium]|nr:sugar phosphate nucleotidyltransferase [Bacteroidia bacterium]MDW8346277.1 sugar phosphate nucleotidyltransferase [Bacteroidia bacterium]